MEGQNFRSIKSLSEDTFFVRSVESIIVINKEQPKNTFTAPGGWGFTDCLQCYQDEEEITILSIQNDNSYYYGNNYVMLKFSASLYNN